MAWYYLDEHNEVCGPVDDWLADDSPTHVGWGDRGDLTRRLIDPKSERGHGIRPCGWERVAFTEVAEGCTVSTVFLGLDHGWGEGPPVVFETLANWGFDYMAPPGEPSDDPLWNETQEAYRALWERHKDEPMPQEWDMERYSTWVEAEVGHKEMVERMRVAIAEKRAQQATIWGEALSSVKA